MRVRRDSLATILPLVEDAVVQESREVLDFVELQAALEYLRTANVPSQPAARRGGEMRLGASERPIRDLEQDHLRATKPGEMAEAAGFEPARGLTLNPLSRSAHQCSLQVMGVLDLRKRLIVWLSERRRTGVNETRTETGPRPHARAVATAMTSRPPRHLSA